MSGQNCPECGNYLAEGKWLCLCGWRSKPKAPEAPKYTCKKCDHTKYLHRCGPDSSPYYLCSEHHRDLIESMEEAKEERTVIQEEGRDYLQDLSEGKI